MLALVEHIIEVVSIFALETIDTWGYLGIFVLSALESAAIPIPSEVVLPFSGFLASRGDFNLWIVAIVATLANLTGSIILYYIGKSGGRWILDKYGKYVLISSVEVEHAEAWFQKHGTKVVFWSRLMPAIRTFISLPAGIGKMNFRKFVLYTTAGALPWNLGLAYVGFKTGENWNIIKPYFKKFDILIVVLLILVIVWYISKHIKK